MSFATTQPTVEEQLLWKQRCEAQRRLAREFPAFDVRMEDVEEYGWRYGPWSCRLVHETWDRPTWHGSVAVLEEIGTQLILKGGIEGPQDALLAIESWSPEHFETARTLLADMFGSLLRAGDRQQEAEEKRGLFSLAWKIRGA